MNDICRSGVHCRDCRTPGVGGAAIRQLMRVDKSIIDDDTELGSCRFNVPHHFADKRYVHADAIWSPLPTLAATPNRPKVIAQPVNLDCSHRGELIDRVHCKSCRGFVRVKVYACTIHGRCTLGGEIESARSCIGCGDRTVISERPSPG